MHKQEALRALKERMKDIPCSDTSSRVVLYQKIEGEPLVHHASRAEEESVKALIDATPGIAPFFCSYGELDSKCAPAGFSTCCYTLDGDIELLVSIAGAPIKSKDYYKVQLRRRQARYAEFAPRLPVALRIPSKHRDLLPSTAGIVDAEADFAIIVPMEFFSSNNGMFYVRQALEEQMYFGIRELQRHFEAEWAKDTQIVYRIPPQREDQESRSQKTHSFHVVRVENPTAGYADHILEISYSRRSDEEREDCHIYWYSRPDIGERSKIRKELYMEWVGDITALILAGFSEIHKKVQAVGYSQS